MFPHIETFGLHSFQHTLLYYSEFWLRKFFFCIASQLFHRIFSHTLYRSLLAITYSRKTMPWFFLPKLSISVLYFSPTSGYKYSTFSKCSKCFILNSLLCFPKSNNLFAVPNSTASIPIDFTGLGI